MNKLNNAQIRCFGCVAIYDYEIIDAKQKIWKGKLVTDLAATSEDNIVFFSRHYDRVNNDVDRMMQEYEIVNESIIGVKFLLVPKDKMLFAYQPPSTIIIPKHSVKPDLQR